MRTISTASRGEEVGLLAGVPVTIKVNVDQAGHATTNGLLIQRELKAKIDNPVVANLRKAGAIIIGRTNRRHLMRSQISVATICLPRNGLMNGDVL